MISYNFKLITTTDIYKINLNAFLDDEDNLYVTSYIYIFFLYKVYRIINGTTTSSISP